MFRDYQDLIAEIADRVGSGGFVARADVYVGLAERMLSSRLRVSDMEASSSVTTDADGLADLPQDFEQMRTVRVGDDELCLIPIDSVFDGSLVGYAIQGTRIRSTKHSTDHNLYYYAELPSLEENNTNWLLRREPEAYLHGSLYQVHMAAYDTEKAQVSAEVLGGIINALNDEDRSRRFGGTVMDFTGFGP